MCVMEPNKNKVGDIVYRQWGPDTRINPYPSRIDVGEFTLNIYGAIMERYGGRGGIQIRSPLQ